MLRLLSLLLLAAAALPAADHPNILLILSDDVGYGDIGCYGCTHAKTPNIDRLAKEGRRFTDAHSPASTCTPTRRALLTGANSWRQIPASGILPGDAPLGIMPGSVTLPSLLQQAGYRTGVVGKWHLGLGGPAAPDGTGQAADWNGEIKPGPNEVGFDYHFIMAATGDRVPTVFVENHRIVGLDPADPISVSYKAKVGTEPTGKENPDQLKLKHTHGHDMTIVNGVGRIGWMTGGKAARWRDEDMAGTFTQKAIAFLDDDKAPKDQPFFLYFATHNIHVPRVPNERFQGTSGHGTRADSIQELDDSVGKVIAALEKSGRLDNTLVIFTSDNGGVMDDGYADFAPGDYKMNGSLRGTKGTLFEGGHRVPFIVRWPGKVPAGTESAALIAQLDLPASLAALTGVSLPADSCPDSINVLPALLGQSEKGRGQFIAHNGGTKGPLMIREGSWKFIQPGAGAGYGAPAKPANAASKADAAAKAETPKPLPAAPKGMLFNLATDPEEKDNLVNSQPEKLKELQAHLQKARQDGKTRE
jgi:arylsulfatase A-like enzyme